MVGRKFIWLGAALLTESLIWLGALNYDRCPWNWRLQPNDAF